MARKNSADVASLVRRSIRDGRYKRFDRLPPSRDLAASFGVARNTLRGALDRLENEGLLETRRGSGTYVTAPDGDAVPKALALATPLELIDARFALEPHICRLCVMLGRAEDFNEMERLCTVMDGATRDPDSFSEADAAFHRALALATRNNLLTWMIEQINTVRQFDEWKRMRQAILDEPTMTHFNAQHREILGAVKARDPERAAAAMKVHLEAARLSLTRAMET